jgi:hypothetical protein
LRHRQLFNSSLCSAIICISRIIDNICLIIHFLISQQILFVKKNVFFFLPNFLNSLSTIDNLRNMNVSCTPLSNQHPG